MLRWRHQPEAQAAGETEGRQETDEAGRLDRNSAGSVSRRAQDGGLVATTAKAREKLEAEISARRSVEQQRASRKLALRETLSSLWAPVTCFGLALGLYIVLIEVHTASSRWAQPMLKDLGLAALVWFAGLLVCRLAVPRPKRIGPLRRTPRALCQEPEV